MAEESLDIVGLGLATLDVLIRLDEMPTRQSVLTAALPSLYGYPCRRSSLCRLNRLANRCPVHDLWAAH